MPEYGLLGRKLSHSRSPFIHSQLGDYEYRLLECEPDALKDVLTNTEWNGLNVTVPYKKSVVPFCSFLSDAARCTGSVNTLVKHNHIISGYNTDVSGFRTMLEESGYCLSGKKILIIGDGGASAAVQYVLKTLGASFSVIHGRKENTPEYLSQYADTNLLINASPVGMYPDNACTPVNLLAFPDLEAVFDLIYNPLKTRLLLEAENRSLLAVNGLTMLCAQAYAASELFTGKRPGKSVPDLKNLLYQEMRNIVLIGMPGAGKSTVGAVLSKASGCPFVDCDTAYRDRFGLSPADALTAKGETVFRIEETEVLKEICKGTGQIIAAGGGVVTIPENLALLRQNGIVVFIDRPLSELSVENRPLSGKYGVVQLAQERMPLYRSWSDYTFSFTGAESTAEMIMKELEL